MLQEQFESEHCVLLRRSNFFLRLSLPIELESKLLHHNDDAFREKLDFSSDPSSEQTSRRLTENVEFQEQGKLYLNVFGHSRIPKGERPHPSFSLTRLGFGSELNQLQIFADVCFSQELIGKVASKAKFCGYLARLAEFLVQKQFRQLMVKKGFLHVYRVDRARMKVRETRKSFEMSKDTFNQDKVVLSQKFWSSQAKNNTKQRETHSMPVRFKENSDKSENLLKTETENTKLHANTQKKPLIVEIGDEEHDFELKEAVKKNRKVLQFRFKHEQFSRSNLVVECKGR